ncbi:hypothetical protein NQ176_g2907 [Zarea fungicola]|uniref:Uncharacterized protein n=1 Tax=Zarea fungicola TaxID=93591 RepID=A0ACC1NNB1_9HYPO|nr:hypothetical protein NQ176_g2907 [Lecanicillium fungicola]
MSVSLLYESKVRAPLAKVWEFLIDSENYTTLNPGCIENGPATISPATDGIPEKREWTAVEATTVLGGLYTHTVTLAITATLEAPEQLVVHDIKTSAGVVVHIEYAIEEVQQQEGGGAQTLLKDTITITAPWYIRIMAASTVRKIQAKKAKLIQDALQTK